LILDEPTVGLDIITARTVIEYVKSFRDQGKCIIYSTHIMREAEKLCDMIAIIHQGNLITQGTLEELKKNSSFDDLEEIFFELINQGENLE
jgi:sodium transport system ATP-binding protein